MNSSRCFGRKPDSSDSSTTSLPLLHDSQTGHSGRSTVVSDVREALLGLGYTEGEIREVLRELPSQESAETLLRDALQMLGVRRAG